MPRYEVKVTASWTVEVEADSEDAAEQVAWGMDWDKEGSYEGVEEMQVSEIEEPEEEEEE